jgi:hypothetical protein
VDRERLALDDRVRSSLERMEDLKNLVFTSDNPLPAKTEGFPHFERVEYMHHNRDFREAIRDFEHGHPVDLASSF